MARCAACGKSILWGGVEDAGLKFCNQKCHQQGFLAIVAGELPAEEVARHAAALSAGPCPRCGRPEPVELQTAHYIWSAIYVTSWNSRSDLSCRSCGNWRRVRAALSCGLFGWWGFPLGLLGTPVQIGRNFFGLFQSSQPGQPSPELLNLVRVNLASAIVDQSKQGGGVVIEGEPAGSAEKAPSA